MRGWRVSESTGQFAFAWLIIIWPLLYFKETAEPIGKPQDSRYFPSTSRAGVLYR